MAIGGLTLLLAACQPETASCSVQSTISGFEPSCETAVMVRYPGESRLFVEGGGDQLLTAYLPEDLESQEYGGTSGNPLVLILTMPRGDEQASSRTSWIRIGEIAAHEIEVHIEASFDSGSVSGTVRVPMVDS